MKHWSASQVSSFRLCARKWYFKNVMNLPEPVTAALEDGKRYAEECEVYMKTGSTAGMSAVTRVVAGIGDPLFPKPNHRTTLVEYPIGRDTRVKGLLDTDATILEVDGVPGVGFMDVCYMKEDRPIVWDFKSTKAKKWVKTTDELRLDVQMSLYAKATSILHERQYGKPPTLVGVGHVAMLKPPEAPEAVVVGPAWMDLDEIETQWTGIQNTVRSMQEVAELPSPDRVTPTWSACKAFGGCPHADKCSAMRSMSTPNTNSQEGTNMTLLEKLAAQQKATNTTAATVAAAPAVVATTDDIAAKLRAKLSSPGQVNPPDAASATMDAGLAAAIKAKVGLPVEEDAPVHTVQEFPTLNTPASARRPRNAEPRLKALGYSPTEIASMSNAQMQEVLDSGVRKTFAPEPVVAAAPKRTTAKPKDGDIDIDLNSNEALEMGLELGYTEHELNTMSDEVLRDILLHARRKVVEPAPAPVVKAKPAPAPTPAPAPAPAPVVAHVAAPMDEQVETAERADRGPLMLFVDCRPAKGFDDAVELTEYLAPMMQMVCEKKKVEHYSLPAYNEGEKLVAALLLMNPPAGLILVDSSLPISRWAMEVLLPLAKLVVRGVR
jgi:hypothetical protein